MKLGQLGTEPPHGTRARWVHRTLACRCSLCRAANNEYMRDWHRAHRQPIRHLSPLCPACATAGLLTQRRYAARCDNVDCRVSTYTTKGR